MRGGSARLGRPRRWGLYAISGLLWASGGAWIAAHYLLVTPGEYGPRKSPLEGWSLIAHGALAMAALWMFGLLWGVHVQAGWAQRRGRWSGGLLFATVCVLVVTGYGLYYLGDEQARDLASLAHWLLGLAGLPLFLGHRFVKKRRVATGPSTTPLRQDPIG